jgi:hypothetical protein
MCLGEHNWTNHRFRHREAARLMFSYASSEIPRLQMQPWASL